MLLHPILVHSYQTWLLFFSTEKYFWQISMVLHPISAQSYQTVLEKKNNIRKIYKSNFSVLFTVQNRLDKPRESLIKKKIMKI